MSDWMEVARVGDIPPGELKAVEYDGAMIVLFNLEAATTARRRLVTASATSAG